MTEEEITMSVLPDEAGMLHVKLDISKDRMLRWNEDIFERTGKMIGHSLMRYHNALLCERDGHTDYGEDDLFRGVRCSRCLDILDRKRWDEMSEG